MCGRYVITSPVSKSSNLVKKSINVKDIDNYNAHPQQLLPVIKKYINGNTLENKKWGIVPSWAKNKDFKPLINARLETINEKISFKKLIKTKRCIAIADGFYEWKRDQKEKMPFYIYRSDKKNIYFAAIYNEDQFCLITENASSKILSIHHRQPVILYEKDVSNYLNLEFDGSNFLKNRNKPNLDFHEISKNVNKPTNNDVSLIEKIN